jgi:hypothetical protein
LRLTRTSRPPISSWPPFFVLFADSASKINPAQVPHVGFLSTLVYSQYEIFKCLIITTHLTKSRRGSNIFDLWATKEMVVLSPPGRIRASHEFNSGSFRTSLKVQFLLVMFFASSIFAAWRRSWTCSLKAPWSANTPTVIYECGSFDPILKICEGWRRNVRLKLAHVIIFFLTFVRWWPL